MIKSQIIHLDMLINFDIVEFCILTRWGPKSGSRLNQGGPIIEQDSRE